MDIPERTSSYGQCFASLALGMSPIFVIFGIAALFGADTVRYNGEGIHGLMALIVAIVWNVVFAAILAGLQKLGYVIIGLFRRWKSETQAK